LKEGTFMKRHRSRALRWVLLLFIVASGCRNNDKPYLRSPLYREVSVTAGPSAEHERATQVEPYPPPRPYLPDEPSRIASASSAIQAASNLDDGTGKASSAEFRSPR